MISAPRIVVVSVLFFPMGLFYYASDNGAGYTISGGLTAPWPIGRRRQRPNYLGLRHWILSLGVDFKWSRV